MLSKLKSLAPILMLTGEVGKLIKMYTYEGLPLGEFLNRMAELNEELLRIERGIDATRETD